MKLENVAKVEKGFIEKTISIQELPNGNVEIVAKAIHTGKKKDQMKKEVSMEATKKAFIMMMGFPLLTLRDKFGFGKERLNRFMDKMLDLYEAYEMDYVDLDDLNDTIMKETGVTLIKKREGKY